jgi:succinate dehydrogenase flavin-adding protein (antitoxin of CptAB toxin-antitoxin module)
MRELDELLLRYLEARYPIADDDEKTAFQAVLALPDPELNGYLLQRQTPSSESVSGVIDIILNMPHT